MTAPIYCDCPNCDEHKPHPAAPAPDNAMRCDFCNINFADRQPGSVCPKCFHELSRVTLAAPATDAATADQIMALVNNPRGWPDLAAIRTAVERVVKDAARLDFLHAEAQKHQVQFAKSLYGTGIELALGYQNVRVVNGDLRAAIDDAMKEKP